MFGRLAPGVPLAQAQAELSTLVARAAGEFPDAYADLAPHVLPYAEAFMGVPPGFFARAGIYSINVFAALFLILCCSNVALLTFARAATREREILVRGALGAGRRRIVLQLFAEALVLGAVAALLGLTATHFGFQWVVHAFSSESDPMPFWLRGGLSPTTLTYAVLLTLLAAAVTRVLPGLKVTRRGVGAGLREMTAGVGGPQMGGTWTGVIIAQIAATVLFTGVAYVLQVQSSRLAAVEAAFPAEEYLAVRLEMEGANPIGERDDYLLTVRELKRQLVLQPIPSEGEPHDVQAGTRGGGKAQAHEGELAPEAVPAAEGTGQRTGEASPRQDREPAPPDESRNGDREVHDEEGHHRQPVERACGIGLPCGPEPDADLQHQDGNDRGCQEAGLEVAVLAVPAPRREAERVGHQERRENEEDDREIHEGVRSCAEKARGWHSAPLLAVPLERLMTETPGSPGAPAHSARSATDGATRTARSAGTAWATMPPAISTASAPPQARPTTSRGVAPSAMWMPISCVRLTIA